jgi:hypothetical protein
MKVIFLDIDGVMNSEVFYRERHKKLWFRLKSFIYWVQETIKYVLNGFKPRIISLADYKPNPKLWKFSYTFKRLKSETDSLKWKWLSQFCNDHDYKICISSTWKNHFKPIEDWNTALIKLGFNDGIFVGITGNRKSIRGYEIKEWIDKHEVEAYAILDDDSDMLEEQMNSFFLVDRYYGLTPNTLYRINRHFQQADN